MNLKACPSLICELFGPEGSLNKTLTETKEGHWESNPFPPLLLAVVVQK